MENKIGPDTTIYVWTGSSNGLSMEECILGPQPVEEWARNQTGNAQEDVAALCDWLETVAWPNGGYYLTADDAEAHVEESAPNLDAFTPRSIYQLLLHQAADQLTDPAERV